MTATPGDGAGGVPRFALYGEQARATDAEFIHIEDIQSRSRRYDWEIRSHTHRGLFQVVLVLSGGARAQLDDHTQEVSAPCAMIIPPAVVHAFQFMPDSHGYVLTIADAVLFDGSAGGGAAVFETLFLQAGVIDLSGDRTVAAGVASLLDLLVAEFRWPLPGRSMMCEWLVRSVLLLLERQRVAATGGGRTERARAELFARFRAMVEDRYAEHWTVPRYAAALGMTESRLNRLCRHLVNRSAFEVIQDRLLLEARRRLTYIAAPVAVIAYELGFQDPAYFNRFFKKLTGETPAAFRRQARGPGERAASPFTPEAEG